MLHSVVLMCKTLNGDSILRKYISLTLIPGVGWDRKGVGGFHTFNITIGSRVSVHCYSYRRMGAGGGGICFDGFYNYSLKHYFAFSHIILIM